MSNILQLEADWKVPGCWYNCSLMYHNNRQKKYRKTKRSPNGFS